MMASNPWQVDSIDEFYFLKCPECMFFSQEENDFKGHAIENHPLSNTLFGNLDNEDMAQQVKIFLEPAMFCHLAVLT